MLIYDDNRCFKDILNLFLDILKYENILKVGSVKLLQLGRRPDKTTKLTGTFLSEKGMTFCVYNFLLEAWNECGKVGFNTGYYWYSLLWPSIFNLSILKVVCQKKPQEDGRGREGGTAFNIRGEVGSIPPYPTFIPTGPKSYFALPSNTVSMLYDVLLKSQNWPFCTCA